MCLQKVHCHFLPRGMAEIGQIYSRITLKVLHVHKLIVKVE